MTLIRNIKCHLAICVSLEEWKKIVKNVGNESKASNIYLKKKHQKNGFDFVIHFKWAVPNLKDHCSVCFNNQPSSACFWLGKNTVSR